MVGEGKEREGKGRTGKEVIGEGRERKGKKERNSKILAIYRAQNFILSG